MYQMKVDSVICHEVLIILVSPIISMRSDSDLDLFCGSDSNSGQTTPDNCVAFKCINCFNSK